MKNRGSKKNGQNPEVFVLVLCLCSSFLGGLFLMLYKNHGKTMEKGQSPTTKNIIKHSLSQTSQSPDLDKAMQCSPAHTPRPKASIMCCGGLETILLRAPLEIPDFIIHFHAKPVTKLKPGPKSEI